MRSLIAGALVVISLAAGALTPSITHAASRAQAPHPACAVKFIIGQQTCYAPAQVKAAEKATPRAVNPKSAVKLTFGLSLSQVSVTKLPGSRGGTQIDYLYGALRHDYGRQGRAPIALRISESSGKAGARSFQPRYTRNVCGTKVSISPAADPQRQHPNYGPWYVVGNYPKRNASFAIVGNAGPKLLETLACRMIPASK